MDKDSYALFKYSIIAPFINGTANTDSVRVFASIAASKQYYFEGEYLTFDEETIRKWIRKYQKDGYDKLKRKTRSDYKKPRLFDDDILFRIDDLKTKYPKLRSTALYSALIKEGYFNSNEISIRTFQRFVANKNYLNLNSDHERRSFRFENSNDSWQTDTTHGPYIVIKGVKYKTYIMVFIDDYSRLVVGIKAFLKDSAINLQSLLKQSIKVYGLPKQIYADNGAPYSNKQLSIICARLGINLKNARPYDPESKGKVERFNRTLKDSWMNTIDWNKIEGIDDLNDRLNEYIKLYNNTYHSVIKKTPNEAYYEASENIKYIDDDTLNKSFYHTVKRKVSNVATVNINNRIYEVDYKYVKKNLEFTYNPDDLSKVYLDGNEYYLLDSIKNSKRKRKKNADYSKIVNKENEKAEEYED